MSLTRSDPTRLGTVEDVTGPTVRVKLLDETAHGLLFVRGEGYRVGQVGSFIRIPAGYVDLFGIVSQVGAGAAPLTADSVPHFGSRWMKVELIGEGRRGEPFRRGISQYPSIGDNVHVVTESDLRTVYAPGDEEAYVAVGRVASSESIRAYVDVNRLISRHSAIVGSTGAGKSTAIASLLAALSDSVRFPSSRVVLLDLHGEYSRTFGDGATIFRLNPNIEAGEKRLCIPFWALALDELISLCFGKIDDKQRSVIADLVVSLKKEAAEGTKISGITSEDITPDTPVPFSIKQLWFRQHCREFRMVTKKQGGSEDEVMDALVVDNEGNPEQPGEPENLVPPKFRTSKTTGPKEQHVSSANEGAQLRQQIAALHSRLRDQRFDFIFSPDKWNPDAQGRATADLDSLLEEWLCSNKPITVIDLSGIPSSVLDELVAALLRVLFDSAFWGRFLPVGGRQRPLLVVLEEAHVYLSNESTGKAATAARRIAKEGRKYGVGLMLVSQRPSEIDPTILSQCGTLISLRLTNDKDRSQIRSCSSDNLEGLFSMLPILRTGEALIVGEAVSIPVRALIDRPPEGRRPDSEDPQVVVTRETTGRRKHTGGWTEQLVKEEYMPLVEAWRRLDPRPVKDSKLTPSTKSSPEKE